MLFECCTDFLTCDRWRDYYGCRFLVSDNGMGMSADFKDTIFDAFTRAESPLTNKIQRGGTEPQVTEQWQMDLMRQCNFIIAIFKDSAY